MSTERRNTAYRIVQFGGLAVAALGVYVACLSIGYGRHLDWPLMWAEPLLLVELIVPLGGLGLSIYLGYIGYLLVRAPSMTTLVQMGVIGGIGLQVALFRLGLLMLPWIKSEYHDQFANGVFTVTFCLTVPISIIAFRRLAKRSGLLDPDASWWHERNIRMLCGIVTFMMFLMLLPSAQWTEAWVVKDKQPTAQLLLFLAWLASMGLMQKAGPDLLMWLIPPRDRNPMARGDAAATRPVILR